jgi:DNA modification methylase
VAETVSVFIQRGLGNGHEHTAIERLHPAPFSYQDVGRLVRFFTKRGGTVLDPLVGVGSTLKACALNERFGVGIELQKRYCDLSRRRLKTEVDPELLRRYPQRIIQADIREAIPRLERDSVDFIVTSPPYWNILEKVDHKARQERVDNGLDTKYSDDPRDLGNIAHYEDFVIELSSILGSLRHVLRSHRYMAVIVGDFRHRSRYFAFHADLAHGLEAHGFLLKGITVLYQKNKRIFPYGYPYSYVPNIHNQFILILQKED